MNENLPPNSMRRRMRRRLLWAAVTLILSVLSFLFLTTNAGQEIFPLVVGAGIVFFVITIPLAIDARWSHRRAQEIDDLLRGNERLAFWTYPLSDESGSGEGTVYVGWQGTYINQEYFHYKEKRRRLERAYLVRKEPLGTLRLICRQEYSRSSEDRRPGPRTRVRYPTLAVPVPPSLFDIAENIVEQFVERYGLKEVGREE
ncbi:MAG: hypothetical protein R3293_07005 [Candidatus Promineifilaceae bacterium]|nr:hypothetical protein [Candidatus Promineifilaceae bacterium]